MYLITDTYGTKQRAWTKREALEWLRVASPKAKVTNIWGKVVAKREVKK